MTKTRLSFMAWKCIIFEICSLTKLLLFRFFNFESCEIWNISYLAVVKIASRSMANPPLEKRKLTPGLFLGFLSQTESFGSHRFYVRSKFIPDLLFCRQKMAPFWGSTHNIQWWEGSNWISRTLEGAVSNISWIDFQSPRRLIFREFHAPRGRQIFRELISKQSKMALSCKMY